MKAHQGRPLFTVFTPTYNRAHTLPRVYASLVAQTFSDFEWLIVDDGSSDGTDGLVRRWLSEGRIRLRYLRQANAGKHVAFNRGVREAQGELFLPLDSDDSCVPNALQTLRDHWFGIPDDRRRAYSGITCLCRDDAGHVVGGPLPAETIDGQPFAVLSRLRRQGEMWGFHRTDVLREFPFPELGGERFVPEGLIWNRIGRLYLNRFINHALRGYHESADSLSAKVLLIRARNPVSTIMYYAEVILLPVSILDKVKAAINVWRFAALGHRLDLALGVLRRHPVYMAPASVPGLMMAWRERAATTSEAG